MHEVIFTVCLSIVISKGTITNIFNSFKYLKKNGCFSSSTVLCITHLAGASLRISENQCMNKQLRVPAPYCMYIGLLRGSNSNNMQYAPSHTSPFHMHRAAICFFSFSVSFAVLVPVKCRAWKLDVICLWSRTEVVNVTLWEGNSLCEKAAQWHKSAPVEFGRSVSHPWISANSS